MNDEEIYDRVVEIMGMGHTRKISQIMSEIEAAYKRGYIDGGVYMSTIVTELADVYVPDKLS